MRTRRARHLGAAATESPRRQPRLSHAEVRHPYRPTSVAEHDQRPCTRILHGLCKRATSLGLELVDRSTGVVA